MNFLKGKLSNNDDLELFSVDMGQKGPKPSRNLTDLKEKHNHPSALNLNLCSMNEGATLSHFTCRNHELDSV